MNVPSLPDADEVLALKEDVLDVVVDEVAVDGSLPREASRDRARMPDVVLLPVHRARPHDLKLKGGILRHNVDRELLLHEGEPDEKGVAPSLLRGERQVSSFPLAPFLAGVEPLVLAVDVHGAEVVAFAPGDDAEPRAPVRADEERLDLVPILVLEMEVQKRGVPFVHHV